MYKLVILIVCIQLSLSEYYEVTDRVSINIKVDHEEYGSIILGLFRNDAPKTVKNFLKIVKYGINGMSYNNTVITKIKKRTILLGGDIVYNNGSGFVSMYGKSFPVESNDINYTAPGFISMLNNGMDQNGCQFFINLAPLPFINGRHTIFGKIIENHQIVHFLERLKTDIYDTPKNIVSIYNARIIHTMTPFYITDETYNLWVWLRSAWFPLTMSTCVIIFFRWALKQLDV